MTSDGLVVRAGVVILVIFGAAVVGFASFEVCNSVLAASVVLLSFSAVDVTAKVVLKLFDSDVVDVDVDFPADDGPAVDVATVDFVAVDFAAVDAIAVDFVAVDVASVDVGAPDVTALDVGAPDVTAVVFASIDVLVSCTVEVAVVVALELVNVVDVAAVVCVKAGTAVVEGTQLCRLFWKTSLSQAVISDSSFSSLTLTLTSKK